MWYLGLLAVVVLVIVVPMTLRPYHPWRSITPRSNEQRYLDWIDRHAKWEHQQRLKKARQRMRVLRRLDARYAKRTTVHVP